MARLTAEQFDNYPTSNSSNWFKLADDGDNAKVQFFAKSSNDLDLFSVHKIKVDGKERYVNCPRNYDDPIDVCPFCAAGMKTSTIMVLSMYNHDTGEINIWTRGRKFKQKLDTLYNEYDVSNTVFKIIRCGKKGSTDTTYEVIATKDNPINLDELERPDVFGTFIMEKSPNDMEYYLATQTFPATDNGQSPQVTRRSGEVDTAPTRSRRGF